MFDAEDVGSIVLAVDDEILEAIQGLADKLEEFNFVTDGEFEDQVEVEEIYEDLSSTEQKKVEKIIRKGVAGIKKAAEKVLAEIKEIDDAVLEDEGEENNGDPKDH